MSAVPAPAPAPAPHRRVTLFKTLAGERKAVQDDEKAALETGEAFNFVDRTWVTLWYDPGHAVRSDCGGMTAFRAITSTGDLLWYVAPEGEAPVYHAHCADPFEAIEHATVALGAQMDLNRRWAHIERLAANLRQGTMRFDVSLEDVRRAATAPIAFRAALSVLRLFGVRHVSGRSVAMLMPVAPKIGFVIHAAWIRSLAGAMARQSKLSRTAPVGFEAIC